MEKAGPGNVGDGRPDLLSRVDYINSKGVNSVPADIIAINAGYQDLSLVVVHKQPAYHFSPFKVFWILTWADLLKAQTNC